MLPVYIGTYTNSLSRGIYSLRMDSATGALTKPELAAEAPNPSFLAMHPSGRFLYAALEAGGPAEHQGGSVCAFGVSRTGELDPLNQQPSGGTGPCHVTMDRAGRNLLVANYVSGSVAVLPIGADGRLAGPSAVIQHSGHGPDPKRQKGPHAHSVNLDPAGRFALVADLGLDKIMVYRFDPSLGTLSPHDPPAACVTPGAGPRHLAFHPAGRFAYVINEMASTVTAFAYDAPRGVLGEVQTVSTLPPGFQDKSMTAEVRAHPSGRFLYGSNRGHDSIAVFAIDAATGLLAAVAHGPTHGRTPRHFAIDPTGAYLLAANQDSNNLVVFRVDSQTGRLEPAGIQAEVPSPVCVTFVGPTGGGPA